MPSGASKTALRIPNTPGSRRVGEDSTGIGKSNVNGIAPRRAVRICRQQRTDNRTLSAQPEIHTTNKMKVP